MNSCSVQSPALVDRRGSALLATAGTTSPAMTPAENQPRPRNSVRRSMAAKEREGEAVMRGSKGRTSEGLAHVEVEGGLVAVGDVESDVDGHVVDGREP